MAKEQIFIANIYLAVLENHLFKFHIYRIYMLVLDSLPKGEKGEAGWGGTKRPSTLTLSVLLFCFGWQPASMSKGCGCKLSIWWRIGRTLE